MKQFKKSVCVLLPCLNEEKTLEKCIKAIKDVLVKTDYDYNILVCDNNSTDKSVSIAKKNKVDVIIEEKKGYGSTLLNGINHTKSDYAVMLDSDMSYNEKDIPAMLKLLDDGYDLVVGTRIRPASKQKPSPLLNKIGASFLSKYANLLFHTKIKDFHCGLRAFKVKEIQKLSLNTPGMEFASEMIVVAKRKNLKMVNYKTEYKKDERGHKGHMRPFRDGFRHFFWLTSQKLQYSIWTRFFLYILFFIFLLLILNYFQ